MSKPESTVGKIKDLDQGGKTLKETDSESNTSAPTPSRGFEPHVDGYANPTEARKIAGSGNQGFGRAGRGPEAANGMDRGDFASRTKLTSKP